MLLLFHASIIPLVLVTKLIHVSSQDLLHLKTYDYNLSFTSHINPITKKAFKMLSFINRNTVNFKNINALKTLIFALVRCHLDFGSIIWSPNYITFIGLNENV